MTNMWSGRRCDRRRLPGTQLLWLLVLFLLSLIPSKITCDDATDSQEITRPLTSLHLQQDTETDPAVEDDDFITPTPPIPTILTHNDPVPDAVRGESRKSTTPVAGAGIKSSSSSPQSSSTSSSSTLEGGAPGNVSLRQAASSHKTTLSSTITSSKTSARHKSTRETSSEDSKVTTASAQVPEAPLEISPTGRSCGPVFGFTFTRSKSLVDYCHVTFTSVEKGDPIEVNSTQGCSGVNVTGLHYDTTYDINVVAISNGGRSSPTSFNFSTPTGNISVEDLQVRTLAPESVTLAWRVSERAGHGTADRGAGFHVQVATRGDNSGGRGGCVVYRVPATAPTVLDPKLVAEEKNNPSRHRKSARCVTTYLSPGPFNGSVDIPGLHPCVIYDVTVTPQCQCFCNVSANASFTTPSHAPNLKDVDATSSSFDSLIVRWSTARDRTVCGRVTYTLTLMDADDDKVLQTRVVNHTLNGNVLSGEQNSSHTFTGLRSLHHYKVQVVAMTVGGSSASKTSPVVQTQKTVPGEVHHLHAVVPNTDATGRSLKLSWKPAVFSAGGMRKYVIYMTHNGTCINATVLANEEDRNDPKNRHPESRTEHKGDVCSHPVTAYGNLTSPRLVISNLLPDTVYTVNVTAVNEVGAGEASVFPAHTPVIVPSAPTNVRVTAMTESSLTLSWKPPVPRPGPTQYNLVVTDMGSPYGKARPKNIDPPFCPSGYETSTCTVNGLQPYWRYSFNLTATTAIGSSPPAEMNNPVETKPAAPGLVQNVQARPLTGSYTSVKVTWDCPLLVDRHAVIIGFNVRAKDATDAENTTLPMLTINNKDLDCDSSFTADVQIHPGRSYIFQVMALGAAERGPWTNTAPYAAPTGPSEAVSRLAVNPASTSLTVTWYRPVHTNGPLVAYVITLTYQSSDCFLARVLWDTQADELYDLPFPGCALNETSQNKQDLNTDGGQFAETFDGLTAEALVNVTVTPYNDHGAGVSSWKDVYLEPGQSDAVSKLSTSLTTATSTTVQWSAPAVTNGHLTQYGIYVRDPQHICIRWDDVFFGSDKGEETFPDHGGPADIDCLPNDNDYVTVARGNDFNVTVTHLVPAATLTVSVYPKNKAGWGLSSSTTIYTDEAVPSAPRHPTVEYLNTTSLRVHWGPPVPRPGSTNYTLVLNRATDITQVPTFLHDRDVHVTGWNSNQTTVVGLWSGWRYSIALTATTSKGSKTVQMSQLFTMPESAPGQVQNLTVLPVDRDYRKLQITWDYPVLKERHGDIVNFTLIYFHETPSMHIQSCAIAECKCIHSPREFCATVDVTPGSLYIIKVKANNVYPGVERIQRYQARIGPPPPISASPSSLPYSSGSQSTVSVTYCATCLLNDTNGQITYFAILVCSAEYCNTVNTTSLQSSESVQNLPSWHEAKDTNFNIIYRATNDKWQNSTRAMYAAARQRRSMDSGIPGGQSTVYMVGQDSDCADKPDTAHCNGPLPAGRSFRVMTVSCTVASCSLSALSQPLNTLETYKGDSFPTLIVIGSLLGVTAGALVIVLVVWFRRRKAEKQCDKYIERGGEEGTEMPEISQRKRPVTMQDFEDRLREWKADVHSLSGLPTLLVQQFKEIRDLSPAHSHTAAALDGNKVKNRYCNILPFDHSRVKLDQIDEDDLSDYINANYIMGFHSKREYIATQGPLERTVDDLWRMVWEKQSSVIVMLSGLMEGRQTKVHKYFPDEDELNVPCIYDSLTVTLQDVKKHKDYLIRTFKVSEGHCERVVRQFYVQNWKDFDANLNASLVLDFARAVRAAVPADNKHPLVVHCSAGVGRTGTWIAIDYMMHYIRERPVTAPIDIFNLVLAMRECRVSMVQSVEQYVFIHDVVRELVRRKTEVDRYDEPALPSHEAVYDNVDNDNGSSGSNSPARRRDDKGSSKSSSASCSSHSAPSPAPRTRRAKPASSTNKTTESSRM